MPLSTNDRQKVHRQKLARYVTASFSMLLEIKAQLEELHNIVATLRHEAISAPIKTLSSSSESMSLNKEVRESRARKPRESEQARLTRLDAWMPNDDEQEKAAEQGHSADYVAQQAELYRCQQRNAKYKHKDFDAGFKAWMLRAPSFEGKANGQGHANGEHKRSAVDNLFLGAARAAEAVARRERARSPPAAPLLDRGRRSGDPTSSN